MVEADSRQPSSERSFTGSAVALAAAIETGRIGRPADKREFLPRFRPTDAGPLQERVMGDEMARPHQSGLEVVTPRGAQEGAEDREGSAARLARLTSLDELPDADQQVRAYREAMASLAAFDRAYWSLDRVLSWIMYRDVFQMDTPHLHGTMYPTMPDVPPVREPAPASRLLQALRRAENPIASFNGGKEVHGSEWESVNFPSAPQRWPQVVFARQDVLREWPAEPGLDRDDHDAPSSSTTEPPLVELSRADRLRAATRTLPHGLKREDRSVQPRRYPFAQALMSAFGEAVINKEWKAEWHFYAPEARSGRPGNAEK